MQNPLPQSDVPDLDLLDAFKSQKVILFIGGGLSANAGLPLWHDLIHLIKRSRRFNSEEEAFFAGLDLPQQAQYLYDVRGKTAVIHTIRDIFGRSIRPSDTSAVHRTITTLPINTIITSNWDELIEIHFERENISLDVIWRDDQFTTTTTRKTLIKMHGTIQAPDSIIFSEDDYYRFATSRSLIKQHISTLLSTSTVLFAGYGYRDFDFKLIFYEVGALLTTLSRKPFIFLPNITTTEARYLENRNFHPISYKRTSPKKASEDFFSDLQQYVSVVAKETADRLRIMRRENHAVLERAHDLIVRNQSNLGPLATPTTPQNQELFGNPDITQLEIDCATNWKALVEHGATARCILSLSDVFLSRPKYSLSDTLQRLVTLKDNIVKYRDKVEVVDVGPPSDNNIDIYGTDCCLKSEKFIYTTKSYSRIRVVRDVDEIRDAIDNFDRKFSELKRSNLATASKLFSEEPRDKPEKRSLLHKYIVHVLQERISQQISAIKGECGC